VRVPFRRMKRSFVRVLEEQGEPRREHGETRMTEGILEIPPCRSVFPPWLVFSPECSDEAPLHPTEEQNTLTPNPSPDEDAGRGESDRAGTQGATAETSSAQQCS
jgi:hypothetical protein